MARSEDLKKLRELMRRPPITCEQACRLIDESWTEPLGEEEDYDLTTHLRDCQPCQSLFLALCDRELESPEIIN